MNKQDRFARALGQAIEHEQSKPEDEKIKLAPPVRRSVADRVQDVGREFFSETFALASGDVFEKRLPLSKLVPDEFNPRVHYIKSKIQERAESLAEFGQQTPIVVYRTDDPDKFAVHEGRYRWQAALLLGWDALEAIIRVRPTDPVDGYFKARVANTDRHDQTALDDAIKWSELIDKGLVTHRVIAEKTKLPASDVSMILRLAKMSRPLAEQLVAVWSRVGVAKAYYIARIEEEMGFHEAERIVARLQAGDVSLNQVKAVLEREPKEKQHYSTKETFSFANGAKGIIKGYKTGKLELSLQSIPENLQKPLFDEIRAVILKYQSSDG